MVDGYYNYAITILLLTLIARGLHLRFLYQTYRATKKAADESEDGVLCRVRFDGVVEEVLVVELVPGDIVKLEVSRSIPADCILLRGSATIEHSFISGESEVYTLLAASPGFPPGPESLLLCGGLLLDASCDAVFLVIATGNQTLQGLHLQTATLRRSSAVEIRFKRVLVACTLFLAAAGAFAFILSWLFLQQVTLYDRIMRSIDVLTDALPPALPVALLVLHLSCSSSLRLPPGVQPAQRGFLPPLILAGLVDEVIFDKTNTITTGEASVVGVACGDPMGVVRNPHQLRSMQAAELLRRALRVSHCSDLHFCTPDPVDRAIREYVNCLGDEPCVHCHENESSPAAISIADSPAVDDKYSFATSSSYFSIDEIHPPDVSLDMTTPLAHSPFDPSTRLTGVLCGSPKGPTALIVRGAPEAVFAASDPSTIPVNFHEILSGYTRSGLRVLAYGFRNNFGVEESRWMLPDNLRFLGLIFIHTTVHPLSTETISELTRAGVKCVLCTGDAEGTARASASAIGLLSRTSLALPLMQDETVYARMTPWSKEEFVRCCNADGRTVMMCGDGTNDIPALCSAAVGLVLNSASSHSRWNTTTALQYLAGGCLVAIDALKGPWLACEVLSQGRWASAAAVVIIRLGVTYAILQLSCVLLLYRSGDNLTDSQYARLDLVYSLPSLLLTALFLRSRFSTPLSHSPSRNPLGVATCCLTALHVLLGIGLQILLLSMVESEAWSTPRNTRSKPVIDSCQSWTLYETLCLNYLSLAIALTLRNSVESWRSVSPVTILALLYTAGFLYKVLHIILAEHDPPLPLFFRIALVGIYVAHVILTSTMEKMSFLLCSNTRLYLSKD
ncbi:Calcium-transporting ATPase 1, plasma membrane-type, putative [Perkinsus marinus ATCC 50983]|uniref:Calcium-transporting ATPase 1, plasma membrane-type, putative n=1 Tax=Perkinsus marinus (strain ATCC 50983 / TXsc) TaxID=423536 RepID=C5L685_PERM5|nr:Calcium-transporting ATPase 1, plasma membrane-type, putative [Perkinsus marinus ATCC 50983]EER07712.1 Calcium-transporting ATPase 1, plasma membrane-type, putative [Perkinsus marinus ATCC 50983]|eukprot:XP_002775896.1 Calcium-transporting ATPase 1, plasma membrane-type, putative [Perkinsus marinus ATCC 50983]